MQVSRQRLFEGNKWAHTKRDIEGSKKRQLLDRATDRDRVIGTKSQNSQRILIHGYAGTGVDRGNFADLIWRSASLAEYWARRAELQASAIRSLVLPSLNQNWPFASSGPKEGVRSSCNA
jgi:hypothetical protein